MIPTPRALTPSRASHGRSASAALALLALALWFSACVAPLEPTQPARVAPPQPPPPVGALVSLQLSGGLTQAITPATALLLDAEVQIDWLPGEPAATGDVRLVASLADERDRTVAWAASEEPLGSGTTAVQWTLTLPPSAPEALALDLYLAADDAQGDLSEPRSPVLRAGLSLLRVPTIPEEGALSTVIDLPHAPTSAHVCDDGRVVLGGLGHIVTLEPFADTPTHTIHYDGDQPVTELPADWRCTRAYGRAGDHFMVFDLLEHRVVFQDVVADLVGIVDDINPRYVLAVTRDGVLRRYYRRDEAWSRYDGRLGASPLLDAQGRLVTSADAGRLAIAVAGPAVCLVTDARAVQSSCATLPAAPRSLALVPFGFGDEAYAPYHRGRAAVEYLDDVTARSTTRPALGQVAVLESSDQVRVVGLDEGIDLGTTALSVSAVALAADEAGELWAVGPHASQRIDPLTGHAWAPRALAAGIDAGRLQASPDRDLVALAGAEDTRILSPSGEVLASTRARPQLIAWHREGHLVALIESYRAVLLTPKGRATLRAPIQPEGR